MNTLNEVFALILKRQADGKPSTSYVASLMAQGTDVILKKIGEEATELLLAAKGSSKDERVHELADLWFHTMVLMAHQGIDLADLDAEFKRRYGSSGLQEKASRTSKKNVPLKTSALDLEHDR